MLTFIQNENTKQNFWTVTITVKHETKHLTKNINCEIVTELELPIVKGKKRKWEFHLDLTEEAPAFTQPDEFLIKLDKFHSIELTEYRKVEYITFKKKLKKVI